MSSGAGARTLEEAILALGRALERDRENGPLHYALAALLFLTGDGAGARREMGSAAALGIGVETLQRRIEEETTRQGPQPGPLVGLSPGKASRDG
jgi:hypothetical protein